MMTRYQDWQSRLQSYLDAHRDIRFRYGQTDCSLFAADCIQAMTGVDLAEWFRGRYASRKEALSLIRERTGRASVSAVAESVASKYGLEQIPVAMARRGDLVLVGRSSLGVVSLTGLDAMAMGKKSIMRVSLSHVVKAWRI